MAFHSFYVLRLHHLQRSIIQCRNDALQTSLCQYSNDAPLPCRQTSASIVMTHVVLQLLRIEKEGAYAALVAGCPSPHAEDEAFRFASVTPSPWLHAAVPQHDSAYHVIRSEHLLNTVLCTVYTHTHQRCQLAERSALGLSLYLLGNHSWQWTHTLCA